MNESLDHPEGTAILRIFHQSNIPLLLEITEPYINMEDTELHDSYWAGTVIRNSQVLDEDNNLVLKIDLDIDEYVTFVKGMNEAASTYMRKQLAFWRVITSRFPGWLMSENVGTSELIADANLDEANILFDGKFLDEFEYKMKHMFELAQIFRKEYNTIFPMGESFEQGI